MTAPDINQSIAALTKQLTTHPNDVPVLHNLAVLLNQAGRVDDALAYAQKAVWLDPNQIEVWLNLGNLHARKGNTDQAISAFDRVTKLSPDDPRGWFNSGNFLALQGRWQESTQALEKANLLAPDRVDILASLGLSYRKHLRLEDAVRTYEAALELEPRNATIHSNLLVALQYKTASTAESLYQAHRQWDRAHGKSSPAATPKKRRHDGPIRVGYVSGDFRTHPIGFFLSGVLGNHDRDIVTNICFSDTRTEDKTSQHLRSHADKWIDTRGLLDTAFYEAVQNEKIDILIDLSGHLSHNRLPVFARRPAPIQATWAGYVGTTGLSAMDWLIADRYHAPNGFEAHTSERIVRLPHDYICYAPPASSPAVGPLPCSSTGFISFGCFNNLVKVNDAVLSLWAKILVACTDSKLVLNCAGLDQPDLCDRIRNTMAENGVSQDRLDLRPAVPHEKLLATYNEIDIALDPFPYSGGLTTLEALWMGVPVVTKTGSTFAGKHSTSHLCNVGLNDWVCDRDSSYVETAISKALDQANLSDLRKSLRQRMADSPVCDHVKFARALEKSYRMMVDDADSTKLLTDRPKVVDIGA